MGLCTEEEMLQILRCSSSVFLLEPNYKRKYVPLGLAKIASFVRYHGGVVRFGRKFDPTPIQGQPINLVCVTSLFTYQAPKVLEALDSIPHHIPILLGGVAASLLSRFFSLKFPDVKVFVGYSKVLDECMPSYYSIDWQIDPHWQDWSFTFTRRGCPNHCAYCAVPKLEPDCWINPYWRGHILFSKPNAMISDNNLSSAPRWHVREVVDYLQDHNKNVMIDNGLDPKFIDEEVAQWMAKLTFIEKGMRTAFDRIEEDGIFQRAMKRLLKAGVPADQIMAYILHNFNDKPQEADYRAQECVKLGITPYPQQFVPLNHMTNDPKATYVGKHWTFGLNKAFRFFYRKPDYYTTMTFGQFIRILRSSWPGALKQEDLEAWYT